MRRVWTTLDRATGPRSGANPSGGVTQQIREWTGRWLKVAVALIGLATGGTVHAGPEHDPQPMLNLRSLSAVSVDGLRARRYQSALRVVGQLASEADASLVSFRSDGLLEYARVDVPVGPMPPAGYPVVVFLHGWVGETAAPTMDFTFARSGYADLIRTFVKAGLVVVTPGYRGHGTVQSRPADGIEFLTAWDNGSYVSPVFYAIDVLNLLEGLPSLATALARRQGDGLLRRLRLDRRRIGILGHSQGGDVALMVLAVCGHRTPLRTPATAGSIWSGTFPDRLVQRAVYHAMETTTEAFVAGDGTWTSTAVGHDGRRNPEFVFGYPPDWEAAPSQRASGSAAGPTRPTVAEAITAKTVEMYRTFNDRVADLRGVSYEVGRTSAGRTEIADDPRVVAALQRVGAFGAPELLDLPLALHHSDRDFYSWSIWNADLCARVNTAGGHCTDYEYPGATHLLGVSPASWFSPPGTADGFAVALYRDVALFTGQQVTAGPPAPPAPHD